MSFDKYHDHTSTFTKFFENCNPYRMGSCRNHPNSYFVDKYNLILSDVNYVLAMSHSSSASIYVPSYASASIGTGSQVMIVNWSGVTLSVAAGPGATLLSVDSSTRIRTRYSAATLIKMGLDTWLLTGDITN